MVGDGEQEEEGGLRFSVENWAESDRVPSELGFTAQPGPTIAKLTFIYLPILKDSDIVILK